VEILQAGLKATGLRGKAIAGNIANLDTPGYRRKDVRFEEFLQSALKRSGADLDDVQAEIFEPRTGPVDHLGNDVDLDVEVGEMVKNGAMYKTYVRLLGRIYRQMESAITGR